MPNQWEEIDAMKIKKRVHDVLKKLPGGYLIEYCLDQFLHVAWGFMIVNLALAIVRASGGDASGDRFLAMAFLLPVTIIMPREIVDQWPIESFADTVLDLIFFGLGGILAWVIYL
jgi:hypothetical protein